MFRISSLAAATAVVSVFASPAMAQDSAGEEHWEGGYVGGSFGLNTNNSPRNESVVFDTNRDGVFTDTVNTALGANAFAPGFCRGSALGNSAAGGCKSDKDDFDYSIRAGYDMQSGNFVYGLVVDATKSNAVDAVTAFSSTPASYTFFRKLDYSFGARVRAGYAAKGALFYATGGGAWGKLKNRFATTNTANSFADNGKTSSWGYSGGGGVEAKVAKNFSLGFEYLYTAFTRDKYVVNVGPGTAPANNPFLLVSGGTDMRRSDKKFDTHSIRLTAAVRF